MNKFSEILMLKGLNINVCHNYRLYRCEHIFSILTTKFSSFYMQFIFKFVSYYILFKNIVTLILTYLFIPNEEMCFT